MLGEKSATREALPREAVLPMQALHARCEGNRSRPECQTRVSVPTRSCPKNGLRCSPTSRSL